MTTEKQSKIGKVQTLLRGPSGASLEAICNATGWQAHSARAALSSLRRKGCVIERRTTREGYPATYHLLPDGENEA